MDFFDSPLFREDSTSPVQDPKGAGHQAGTIDFESELNPEQYAAVSAPVGPALVLAGAGSGKTRTLTYRVAWLLKQGYPPEQILLLTFTNKAAREMLDRVESLTGVPADRFWGGTFHHIGQKILRRHGRAIGIEPGFSILDAADAESLLAESIRTVNPKFLKAKENPKARVLADWISLARNTLRPLSDIVRERAPFQEDLGAEVGAFARQYEERKREQQVADFDDLLELWLRLLQQSEEVSRFFGERFGSILVDEYQDTNALQSSIIEAMAPHHRIMAVGDDAQCIYTWRGADFENIRTFPDRHEGCRLFKIETNYRSTPEILAFANGVLFGQSGNAGFEKELRPTRETGFSPAVITTTDTTSQADFIVRRIGELADEFRLQDIAILYRAHYHAMDLQLEFSRRGIPYLITSGVRFFEQAHIRDVAAQIRFVINPRDSTAFLRFACLLPKIGPRTAEKLHTHFLKLARSKGISPVGALIEPEGVKKVPAPALEEWGSLTASLIEAERAWKMETPPAKLVEIISEGWYADYLSHSFDNYRDRIEDLKSVIGFAQRYETIEDFLIQISLNSSETGSRSVDLNDEAIRMTTVHQAKGLEFPVVFVIGAADGLFPLQKAIDLGDVEEERRLFYVAVTRAKDQLYLLYPKIVQQGGPPRLLGPSRFISTVSEHQYQKVRYAPKPAW